LFAEALEGHSVSVIGTTSSYIQNTALYNVFYSTHGVCWHSQSTVFLVSFPEATLAVPSSPCCPSQPCKCRCSSLRPSSMHGYRYKYSSKRHHHHQSFPVIDSMSSGVACGSPA
jgi:hypothetical protein